MPDDSCTSREDVHPDADQRKPDADLTDLVQRDRAVNRPMAGTLRFDDDDHDDLEIEQGANVLTADNEKIGEVLDITGDYLVVERGFFMPEDIYLPKDVIATQDDAGLHLVLSRKQLEARDWSSYPHDDGEATP